MKTEVIMKRELFGEEISQKSKCEFFSATDLVKAGNKWRINNGYPMFNFSEWLKSKSVKDFILALESKYGTVKINSRGRNSHTWVHPFLFIDLALAINPELKIEVYSWLFDHLLRYRNDSGDSYKKMCGALYENIGNKREFQNYIKDVSKEIRNACGVDEDWQKATENQLKLRDKIHENIALLCDVLRDNSQAVKIGILKSLEDKKNNYL